MDAFAKAAQNRSIRTIKTELDFLLDSSLLTHAQVSQITAVLPSSADSPSTSTTKNNPSTNAYTNGHYALNRTPSTTASTFSEKSPIPTPTPSEPPPPAYPAAPASIATATSLYAFNPTDAGDLALQPHDRILITKYENADWARGRNERTGAEGIFPRSYVNVIEEKKGPAGVPSLPIRNQTPGYNSGYGNMPVEVAGQTGAGMAQQPPPPPGAVGTNPEGGSKFNEQGKKFGKKLGNAAIFGAGASIGSNIVNGIF